MKTKEVIRAEERAGKNLKPYLSTGLGNEADKLLKKGTQIFIHIDGYIVVLKWILPVEVDFVVLGEKTETTKQVLEDTNGNNSLFQALDNNMMQKIL